MVVDLTRETVNKLKTGGEGSFKELVSAFNNAKSIIFILENLGSIPRNFDLSWVKDLLKHKSKDVRTWAVKTIGKSKNDESIDFLKVLSKEEEDTVVKREIVSSIGRMRSEKGIDILVEFLKDEDPKIVCQAIRGLLVFRDQEAIANELKKLINHENEMVRQMIEKEFSQKNKKSFELPHPETYDYLKNAVVHGDTIEIMGHIPNDSIHLTFTSPPYYNARDYSIYPSYEAYLSFLADTFKEVHRITKEGRFLIVNTSPIIIPRMGRNYSSTRHPIPFDIHHDLVNMGWEFIDDIVWVKPEPSVKNRVGGFMQHRKPLAYKPNTVTEYLMVYRKKTTKLIDWNIKQYSDEIVEASKISDSFESKNTWFIDPKSDKIHSAIFPQELCRRVIQLYSFKNDLIYDPFGGSGTLGKAAYEMERYFFMTEQDNDYFERIKDKFKNMDLFNKFTPRFLTIKQFQNDTN